MGELMSVLIVNKSKIDEPGIMVNAAFVLGLSAGRLAPPSTFGPDVTDGDGNVHAALTQIGHIVRKATGGKLRTLRDELAANPAVTLVDYTEDAAPADYDAYATALGAHRGEEIEYRALHASGPREILEPLTKSLSRL